MSLPKQPATRNEEIRELLRQIVALASSEGRIQVGEEAERGTDAGLARELSALLADATATLQWIIEEIEGESDRVLEGGRPAWKKAATRSVEEAYGTISMAKEKLETLLAKAQDEKALRVSRSTPVSRQAAEERLDRYVKRMGVRVEKPVSPDWLSQAVEAGLIPRAALQDGAYYYGRCRNARCARWDKAKGAFTYKRTKMGASFPEIICHPQDDNDNGFDLFLPVALVMPTAEEKA